MSMTDRLRTRVRTTTVADLVALSALPACTQPDVESALVTTSPLQSSHTLAGPADEPLATATLLIEPKFTRAGGRCVAHVSELMGGPAERERLLRHLLVAAQTAACYKVILDAPESDAAPLLACGFERKERTMVAQLAGPAAAGGPSPLASHLPRALSGEQLQGVRLRGLTRADWSNGYANCPVTSYSVLDSVRTTPNM